MVADLRTLQVETSDVDEFLVSKVGVGQRVQISVDALDNLALSGTVSNVALLPQTVAGGNPAYRCASALAVSHPRCARGCRCEWSFPRSPEPREARGLIPGGSH